MTATGVATAQETTADVDVAAVGEAALAADPEALATGLETPPDDAILPEGIINPPSGASANAEILDQLAGSTEALANFDGVVSSVSHGFDTDPAIVPGLLSSGILTYTVVDHAITAEDLNLLEERALQDVGGGTPAPNAATPGVASEGSVQRINLGGVEAFLLTVSADLGVVKGVVQIVAVPVGNTMVIGTMLVADQGEVDQAQVRGFAEALTLAGVDHLGTVAEGAQ